MSKDRSGSQEPRVIEGADDGALGRTDPPQTAPPGARVDASEHRVPGAHADEHPGDEAKPWFTSLAARDRQAGVANEAPESSGQPSDDPLTDAEVRGRSE
jgi:hypothetical protein